MRTPNQSAQPRPGERFGGSEAVGPAPLASALAAMKMMRRLLSMVGIALVMIALWGVVFALLVRCFDIGGDSSESKGLALRGLVAAGLVLQTGRLWTAAPPKLRLVFSGGVASCLTVLCAWAAHSFIEAAVIARDKTLWGWVCVEVLLLAGGPLLAWMDFLRSRRQL